ncbi:hypothetical protein [uncultured Legionella sp.]|nr:hypothetical protein [uncultured Legionella sp.]
MKNNNILMPLFKTIDNFLFGVVEEKELEQQTDFIDSEHKDEFEMEQSGN